MLRNSNSNPHDGSSGLPDDQPKKIGRWTPEEKTRFTDGKFLLSLLPN